VVSVGIVDISGNGGRRVGWKDFKPCGAGGGSPRANYFPYLSCSISFYNIITNRQVISVDLLQSLNKTISSMVLYGFYNEVCLYSMGAGVNSQEVHS